MYPEAVDEKWWKFKFFDEREEKEESNTKQISCVCQYCRTTLKTNTKVNDYKGTFSDQIT